MDAPRRRLLKLATVAAVQAALPVRAQLLPQRPVSVVMPFPPGGPADAVVRFMAQQLKASIGQSAIIDYRPGGTGAIANNYTRRQPPDGSTLAIVATSFTVAPATSPAVHNYDPTIDFTPIARLSGITSVFVAGDKTPFRSFPDLLAHARAHPGQVTVATSGAGANNHLFGLQLAQAAKLDLNFIHFKGAAEETQALMGGNVDVGIQGLGAARAAVDTGRARMLAVATSRSELMPDLPPVADFVPGLEMTSYLGLVGPPRMAPALAERISALVAEAWHHPEMQPLLRMAGQVDAHLPPADFSRYLAEDLARQRAVVKASGLKFDT